MRPSFFAPLAATAVWMAAVAGPLTAQPPKQPEPLPPEVVAAWQKAGFRAGWKLFDDQRPYEVLPQVAMPKCRPLHFDNRGNLV
jgi:hypothetical protein